MRTPLLSACIALPLMTTGCGAWNVDADRAALREAQPQGGTFTTMLAKEYERFADFEADQMRDWISADHFARKALRAKRGELVEPEELDQWRLPRTRIDEMTRARKELVAALNAGAWLKSPASTAQAQANFDCWVEQQEENWQVDHIAACRNGFYTALGDVKLAMRDEGRADTTKTVTAIEPSAISGIEALDRGTSASVELGLGESAPAPVRRAMEPAIAFFDVDQTALSPDARDVIRQALPSQWSSQKVTRVLIFGHADRAGLSDYNDRLSLKRAEAVKSELITAGVPETAIYVQAYGERKPLVKTRDGTLQQLNRRAEMIVEVVERK